MAVVVQAAFCIEILALKPQWIVDFAHVEPGELPKAFSASGISDKAGFMALFSSHPPIEARIAALESRA